MAREVRRRDLVHVHNHYADSSLSVTMLAALLGGFTYSFTIHGPGIFSEAHRWNLGLKVERALFACCISWFARSQTMLWADPEHWEKMHVVHCGVEPEAFARVEHLGEGTRLLFIGRLASVKGLPVLFEALAQLRDRIPRIELRLVGDGPERAALERAVARLGLNEHVHFLGYRSQAEIRDLLGETDVFVLPSFAEGVPAVLMEAFASGVPAVATMVGGTSELVEHGVNGLLVPPGDAQALARAVERVLADASLRNALGTAGRRTVASEFNLRQEAAWLHRILRSSLDGRPEPVRPGAAAEAAPATALITADP
jgi:glycosyltransferase involved in cell wall biosynthesis